jgi:hypothetical protein
MREAHRLPVTACLSVDDAEKELWRALSDGRLVAEALDAEGRLVDVPQREWSYLKLFEDGKRDVLTYGPLDNHQPFTSLKLKRDDLRRIWPATPPTSKGETDCRKWLISLMAASPKKKPKSKLALLKEAQTKFRGLGKRGFDHAWKSALEETGASTWGMAGAPRKESNHRTS